MKKLILVFIILLQPSLAFANQPLSKSLITSFYAASDKLDGLEGKYPKEFRRLDEFSMSEKTAMISYLKSSNAYSDVKSVLSSEGFSNLDEFFDVTFRLMGGMYMVQMKKMPKGSQNYLGGMEKMMQDNIKMMQKNGMPEDMIAGMKAELQSMKQQNSEMQKAAKVASKADIKFVENNFEWIMSITPDEEELAPN